MPSLPRQAPRRHETNSGRIVKEIPNKLPEKFPKKIVEGPKMDYSGVAFPKPKAKPKKRKWGKK